MRMEASLQMRQEMRMRLAPQIIQSIEILQLPLIELRQRVDQELLENPLLEQGDPAEVTEAAQAETPETSAAEAPTEETVEEVTVGPENEPEQFERFEDMANYYADSGGDGRFRVVSTDANDARHEAYENSPAPEMTLSEFLLRQLAYLELEDTIRQICENIVSNLDNRGYLAAEAAEAVQAKTPETSAAEAPTEAGPLEQIVSSMGIPVSPEQAQEALAIVQGLDPPGVGARNLQECLILQLDHRQADYDLLRRLITGHFEDIFKNRYPKLARETGLTIDEINAAVEKIGKLDPLPGSLFDKPIAPHVMPDVIIEEMDGQYVVTLEDTWLPPLRVSAYYARRLQEENLDPKTREYLQKKLLSAQGLIAAIQQRRSTVYNVVSEIMKVQKGFLDRGRLHLKPLRMQDVADKVGVHVSTISRAIAEKYAQTPRGIFPLKYFFTGGLAKDGGGTESWEVVRQKLLSLVANEDKNNPMSDEQLANELIKQGINIARRTVSKYRKTLKVPPSRLRRHY